MEGLGIDLKWFLFQLGNFSLLLILLTFLLHKPLLKLLDNRRQEVSESLQAAEEMRQQITASEKRQQEKLIEAQQEAARLLKEIKQQAVVVENKLQEEAKAKAEKLRQKVSAEIQQERTQMKEELRGELADMVIKASEIVIGEQLPESRKKEQISKLLKEIKS